MSSKILLLADLHLGLSSAPGLDWALNAVRAGQQAGAEYFIFAGDLIDRDHVSPTTVAEARALFDATSTLFTQSHFIAGNHDVHASFTHPECIFHSIDAHSFRCGEVVVHTAAVAADPDERRVIEDFPPALEGDAVHLGVLHTSLTGDLSRKECLPASDKDLVRLGYAAWALGHVHAARTVNEQPFIGWIGMGGALLFDPAAPAPMSRLVVR